MSDKQAPSLKGRDIQLDAVPAPPREIKRAIFHVIATTSAVSYFYFTHTVGAYVLLTLGTLIVVFDFGRSRSATMRQMIPPFMLAMVRKKETQRISAITDFILAATLVDALYLFLDMPKSPVLLAAMFVAVGDPLARLVGTSLRSPRLLANGKTLAGSLAFYLGGMLAATTLALLFGAPLGWQQVVLGGVALTILELVSGDYDNFTIPFFGTLIMWTLA